MKFLLTSAGITNSVLAKELIDLVNKPPEQTSVLFIPTAANTTTDDKGWLIDNLVQLQKQNFKSIDILDIAGLKEKEWLPHFEAADLICFGGGNEQYLAQIIRDCGLEEKLPQLLEDRVYMGISAGSMVVGQFLSQKIMRVVYPEEVFEEITAPLAYVDCVFIPHLNSDSFVHVRKDVLESLKSETKFSMYSCDDNSALRVVDGKIEAVGEGETLTVTQ